MASFYPMNELSPFFSVTQMSELKGTDPNPFQLLSSPSLLFQITLELLKLFFHPNVTWDSRFDSEEWGGKVFLSQIPRFVRNSKGNSLVYKISSVVEGKTALGMANGF